jgi:WD40 repeat protein
MYDTDLSMLHEVTCVAKQASKEENFYILDADYIPVKNLLAVSSSDHAITLWSIVNPTSGAYVLATKFINRYPIIDIHWCTAIRKLRVVSSEWAKFWDVESQTMETVPPFHKGRITDLIDLPSTPYFATCSYDHEIAVWDSKTVTVAFSLRGHSKAVLHLDYAQDILLSCGFEHQAYCWSITNRSILTTLAGHHHSLIGAKMISSRANSRAFLCVTGDTSGHFKLWDISRCIKGFSVDVVVLVQSFDIHTSSTCNFHTFTCGLPPVESGESDANDILCGSLNLFLFRAVAPTDDVHPPCHVVFNVVSNTFVGAVDGCVTVWNSNSGLKVGEPITLHDAEICGMAFDVPRERKLFVATSVCDSMVLLEEMFSELFFACRMEPFACIIRLLGF